MGIAEILNNPRTCPIACVPLSSSLIWPSVIVKSKLPWVDENLKFSIDPLQIIIEPDGKILLISWIYIGDIERILLNYDYTLITYTITLTTQRTNCNYLNLLFILLV